MLKLVSRKFKRPTSITAIFLLLFFSCQFHIGAATRSPARGKHGMVASTSELASNVGADVLKRGGNAIDAAVAVALALAVTYPNAGNLGGGGFMLIHLANGNSIAIDYREIAPAKAQRNMYLDQNGNLIENLSTQG